MMTDNKETAVLFILLRSGLWEKEPEDLSLFPLSGGSWRKVFDMARQQTVTGTVYEGLCRLPDRLLPPEGLLMQWTVAADIIEQRNRRTDGVLAELCGLFRNGGLHPVLLKGQGVAQFYGKPLLRECGDIDLYFPTHAERLEAEEIITGEQGRAVRREADGSIHYLWHGIPVEHHPRLLDMGDPHARKYLEAMEARLGYARLSVGTGTEVEVPSPPLNLLLLSTHIMKHAMGWGIGLRQLCDMARACHRLHGCTDAEAMEEACRRTGIGKWSRLLHSFLTVRLGLPSECLPYRDAGLSPAPLLDIVMRGGNFGFRIRGKEAAQQPAWRHKLGTSYSFIRNIGFSGRYMPREAFWTFANLFIGQFR